MSYSILNFIAKSLILAQLDIPKALSHDPQQRSLSTSLLQNYLGRASNVVSPSVVGVMRIWMESSIEAKQLKRMYMLLVAFIMQCVLCFLDLFSTLNVDALYRYSLILFLFMGITTFK